MKTLLRRACILLFMLASFGLHIYAAGSKNIVYIYDSSWSNYCGLNSDPVYATLCLDYSVKPMDIANYNSTVGKTYIENMKGYDLVVLSDAMNLTHSFPLAAYGLIGKVPFLNFKVYMYNPGRWGVGTASSPTAGKVGWNKIVVNPDFANHAIFNGITADEENKITVFDGIDTKKSCVQNFLLPKGIFSSIKSIAFNGASNFNSIHEYVGESGKDYYMLVPFSFDNITSLTDDGKTIIRNAADYLIKTKGDNETPEKVKTPVVSVSDGVATISCETEGATIYYNFNESAIRATSSIYDGPVAAESSSYLYAVAVKEGMPSSDEAKAVVMVLKECPESAPKLLDPENLGRGAIAYKTKSGILISWRIKGTEDLFTTSFNVYRDGVRINENALYGGTNFSDINGNENSVYTIETLYDRYPVEMSEDIKVWNKGYINVKLDRPADLLDRSGDHEFIPGDVSVGDVDGDGEYELILKWDPSNQMDNSLTGYTGRVYIDCYKLSGKKLWRIDLGPNIRAGAHYTQFMVYDFDGDGKAEMACKTAPGTKDGLGNYVIMGDDDPTTEYLGKSGKTEGVVIGGPEYLTMFNGETGAEITSIAYEPARGKSTDWGKDDYFNRSERYLACVAYLDGKRPSLVMCRGYYQRAAITAYNFDGEKFSKVWARDDKSSGSGCYGEGAHSIAVADVDGDGCDEIIFGSSCINNDGTMLYRTGWGHGDALHVGDFDPDRPGLEVFMVHEEKSSSYPWDTSFRDAKTGKIIWGLKQTGNDIGRGLCADMDSTKRGTECWPIGDYTSGSKTNAVFDCQGNLISTNRPSVNFRVYWMDNLYEQVLEEGKLDKWTNNNKSENVINFVSAYGCGVNLIKNTPALQADILGDWREEIIYYDAATKSNLMIFPSPYYTHHRIPTLMHDHVYRMSIAWQNVAYNQPPHLGYYLPDYGDYVLSNRPLSTNKTISEERYMEVNCPTIISDRLTINISSPRDSNINISIVNLSGMKVSEYNTQSGHESQITLSGLNSLSSGMYMLIVNNGEETVTKKLIK